MKYTTYADQPEQLADALCTTPNQQQHSSIQHAYTGESIAHNKLHSLDTLLHQASKASTSSKDLPLVSGTMLCVKMTVAKQMAAKNR